jgi:hypothetical protein
MHVSNICARRMFLHLIAIDFQKQQCQILRLQVKPQTVHCQISATTIQRPEAGDSDMAVFVANNNSKDMLHNRSLLLKLFCYNPTL